MKKHYSISIPKPCHEDWNAMSPKEKGKFCNSCSKTVIDFTKMNTCQIQDFINDHKNKRICGHFKQDQLDSINIYIPSQVLEQRQSFHKLFLLALLITMGTSLMNCTNKNGSKQKIDSIEVIDTVNNRVIDTTKILIKITSKDNIIKKSCSPNSKKTNIATTGKPIIDSAHITKPILNAIKPPEPILDGMIELLLGEIAIAPDDDAISCTFMNVDSPPQFKNTPSKLSNQEKKDYFSKQVDDVVSKNFNTTTDMSLTGRQRISTQFTINRNGNIENIKIRTAHPSLEKEARRVINLLPQFEPAKQRNRLVKMIYNLPIIFQIEE